MEHAHSALIACLLVGCVDPPPTEPTGPAGNWADEVWAANGSDPDDLFGDPSRAANGARGGGCCGGGVDVYSVTPGAGRDSLVLGFSSGPILDGPGPELVVFENPFDISGGGRFMDPVVVYVSADGFDFVSFPVDYRADDPTGYSSDPTHWVGFAGITPVLLHEDENPVDPFDAELAGGDRFDFDALPDGPITEAIRAEGASHVMLIPASLEDNPVTGEPYPTDPIADGPDIDAVYGVAP